MPEALEKFTSRQKKKYPRNLKMEDEILTQNTNNDQTHINVRP